MIRLTDAAREYAGLRARLTGRRVRALDGVSLSVPPGEALGIVGPNGAGKSTLIRLLLGYVRPTAGTVEVGGLPPRTYAERHGIGYVPELAAIPPGWTVRGAMLAYAAAGDVEDAHERIERELARFGVADSAGAKVRTLSKGTVQRLALAQAWLGDRRVLLLDEPSTGLDPEWIARLRDAVGEWRRRTPDGVVVMASHDLDEVEATVDRVVVLEGGRIRETVDLRAPARPPAAYRLEVEGEGAADAVRAAFPGARALDAPGAFRVSSADAGETNRRLALLLARGVAVRALVPERVTLQDRVRASDAEEAP